MKLRDDVAARLDDVSKETSRDADELVNEAVSQYLDYDERFRELVREGLRQADAGELRDFDEVASKLRARIAKDRAEHGR